MTEGSRPVDWVAELHRAIHAPAPQASRTCDCVGDLYCATCSPSSVPPEPPPEPDDLACCHYCSETAPRDRMLQETSSGDPICKECSLICEDCGAVMSEGDARCLSGRFAGHSHNSPDAILCDDCVRWCAGCQEEYARERVNFHAVAGGGEVCESCLEDYYPCYSCGDYIHSDDIYTSSTDDESRCSECHSSHIEDQDERETIRDYHSSRDVVAPIASPASIASGGLYFGVELEVERRHMAPHSADQLATQVGEWISKDRQTITEGRNVRAPILCFEEDGSLSDGFEMVTAPMGLDDQRRLWARVLSAPAMTHLRSHDTTTCGLHIHLTRRALTTTQIAKIVTFVNDPDNEKLIYAIARRYGTGFCNIKAKKLTTAHVQDDSRYQAVNLWNSRTIELRIFKGSIKLEAVLAALEFANALVRYCAPCSGSGYNLKTPAFLDFIATCEMRGETKHLRHYLADRLSPSIARPANFLRAHNNTGAKIPCAC
jgi:hypothetical protein